jgi:uncharacterized membrane protein
MTQTRPTSTATSSSTSGGASTPWLRAFQAFAALAVLTVLYQFVTAGQLLPQGGPGQAHAGGAIVLHVFSGLAAVAAVVLWRRGQASRAVAVLAVVVFLATFVQAAIGGYDSLYVHVPGAMLLTAGVVWLLLASLRTSAP